MLKLFILKTNAIYLCLLGNKSLGNELTNAVPSLATSYIFRVRNFTRILLQPLLTNAHYTVLTKLIYNEPNMALKTLPNPLLITNLRQNIWANIL